MECENLFPALGAALFVFKRVCVFMFKGVCVFMSKGVCVYVGNALFRGGVDVEGCGMPLMLFDAYTGGFTAVMGLYGFMMGF